MGLHYSTDRYCFPGSECYGAVKMHFLSENTAAANGMRGALKYVYSAIDVHKINP
jgi:hypothetical protein